MKINETIPLVSNSHMVNSASDASENKFYVVLNSKAQSIVIMTPILRTITVVNNGVTNKNQTTAELPARLAPHPLWVVLPLPHHYTIHPQGPP